MRNKIFIKFSFDWDKSHRCSLTRLDSRSRQRWLPLCQNGNHPPTMGKGLKKWLKQNFPIIIFKFSYASTREGVYIQKKTMDMLEDFFCLFYNFYNSFSFVFDIWKKRGNRPTDGRTDRRMDIPSCRDARTHLNMTKILNKSIKNEPSYRDARTHLKRPPVIYIFISGHFSIFLGPLRGQGAFMTSQ